MPKRANTDDLPSDPIERIVAIALRAAGIAYERPVGPDLDFVLVDSGVRIECKQFHAARVAGQMARYPDVIAIQGRGAAEAFANMIAPPRH